MKHTITEYRLDSGANGLVVSVPGASVVNLVVRFNSGYQFGDFSKYELPHVMEHLIGCGSKKYPKPGDFKVELEKNGAMRNAYTGASMNGYVAECAAFEADRVLDLFEEWLVYPIFPEEALAVELSNVREELTRNTTQYASICAINVLSESYPREYMRYEERIEQLKRITREDVLNHYRQTHRSDNMRFYIAGDFPDKGKHLVERIEKIAAGLERGTRLDILDERAKPVPKPILQTEDIKQIYYRLSFRNDGLNISYRPMLQLLRVALFGGYRSRIYGKARERGLAYHISGGTQLSEGEVSLIVEGYVTETHIRELFKLVKDELEGIVSGKMDAKELHEIKDLVIGSTLRGYQTASDMLGWYVGDYDELGIIYPFEEHLQLIRDVTQDEIQTMAKLLLEDVDLAVSLVGPLDKVQAESISAILR